MSANSSLMIIWLVLPSAERDLTLRSSFRRMRRRWPRNSVYNPIKESPAGSPSPAAPSRGRSGPITHRPEMQSWGATAPMASPRSMQCSSGRRGTPPARSVRIDDPASARCRATLGPRHSASEGIVEGAAAGTPDPVCWDTLPADYLETGFDLVAFFDCLRVQGPLCTSMYAIPRNPWLATSRCFCSSRARGNKNSAQRPGCTVYAHRPRGCRTYDCRLFSLLGIVETAVPVPHWTFSARTREEKAVLFALHMTVVEHSRRKRVRHEDLQDIIAGYEEHLSFAREVVTNMERMTTAEREAFIAGNSSRA